MKTMTRSKGAPAPNQTSPRAKHELSMSKRSGVPSGERQHALQPFLHVHAVERLVLAHAPHQADAARVVERPADRNADAGHCAAGGGCLVKRTPQRRCERTDDGLGAPMGIDGVVVVRAGNERSLRSQDP